MTGVLISRRKTGRHRGRTQRQRLEWYIYKARDTKDWCLSSEAWNRFSLIHLRWNQPCGHLDFRFPALRTLRECICAVLSGLVCGTLLLHLRNWYRWTQGFSGEKELTSYVYSELQVSQQWFYINMILYSTSWLSKICKSLWPTDLSTVMGLFHLV